LSEAIEVLATVPMGDYYGLPSDQDKVLTRALVLAAQTIQIKVLDHLIVSTDRVFSFRQEGLL
jgi:DNA repair protein RadC